MCIYPMNTGSHCIAPAAEIIYGQKGKIKVKSAVQQSIPVVHSSDN